MAHTARFRFGRPLPTAEPEPVVARCSGSLCAEIEAVTPSWNDGPERLPRQTVSYEDREYGAGADVPEPAPAAKPRAPAVSLAPDAAEIIRRTLRSGPWHVKDICGMTELPFQAVYRVLMTMLRKKQVTRALDAGSHYLYTLVPEPPCQPSE